MSLRIKHLNADSSFFLIFSPSCAPDHDPSASFPGSFTILLDPWLTGSTSVWHPKFANTTHVVPACISSLADLSTAPDLVLISQDKQDHCHRDTLTQLPADTAALILGTAAAVKKIRAWNHFDPDSVQALQRYDEIIGDPQIYRIEIPPFSPLGTPGEVTVTLLGGQRDLTGLHNAIGITYRAPSSVLTAGSGRTYIPLNNLPPTPPTTPPTDPSLNSVFAPSDVSSSTSRAPSSISSPLWREIPKSNAPVEPTISVLYSPHGLQFPSLLPWATSHLIPSSALPLSVMLHPFTRVSNPWYLGGNITAGAEAGAEVARRMGAKVWIGAHDEDKVNTGISVRGLTTKRWGMDEVRRMVREGVDGKAVGGGGDAQLIELDAGAEFYFAGVPQTMAAKG